MVSMPHWPIPPWGTNKYGLENSRVLLARLGNPHLKLPPVIHIAGTNGKGSTLAFLRSILENAGLRVHVYTSPHLIEFNERIVLASEKIDDGYLFDVHERARVAASAEGISPTFFEGVTAAAFLAFSEVPADILLLETGMGGRLDATNIVPRPLLTIITTISYDHTDHLGNTLEAIAYEKAGIIKLGVPCVISCEVEEVYKVLFAKCEEMRAPITAFGYDFGVELLFPSDERSEDPRSSGVARDPRRPAAEENRSYFKTLGIGLDDLSLPKPSLRGDHQIMNASTALAAISLIREQFKITDDNIIQGLQKAKWPGRLQKINERLWADGAHNPNGGQVLALFCQELEEPISLIVGFTKNRDPVEFLKYFSHVVTHIFCVQVRSEASSYSASRLAELAAPSGIPLTACDSLAEALELASRKEGTAIVTGSLFLVADLLKLLQLPV
jgi:dihydrofolate synthase/folylpolyglutamate synthase